MHNFRKLDIWIDSVELADIVYTVTANFPRQEIYGLASQMQRAAVSIPSNIAEGSAKSSDKEFSRFLSISLGSLYELETQVVIASRRGYVETPQTYELITKIDREFAKACVLVSPYFVSGRMYLVFYPLSLFHYPYRL